MRQTVSRPAHPDAALSRIWRTVQRIPQGRVATYGQVADQAGLPRRARLVGHALRRAPQDLALPWHRVINAQGRLSFPRGSDSYRLQRERLESEGVTFIGGRIDLGRYGWLPSLDELLWSER